LQHNSLQSKVRLSYNYPLAIIPYRCLSYKTLSLLSIGFRLIADNSACLSVSGYNDYWVNVTKM